MTTRTPDAPPSGATSTTTTPLSGRGRRLPRRAPAGLFVLGAVVGYLLAVVTGGNYVLGIIYAAVLGTLLTWGVSRAVDGRRAAADRLTTCLVVAAFLVAMIPLLSLVYVVISKGAHRFDSTFFTNSMVGVIGAGGGAYHAILGTLIITLLTSVISVPIGLLTAVYLVEYGHGRLARSITFMVDVMTGIPSIVAGLFAYALFAIFFGPGIRMGLAGAVALSVLMIPVVVRSTEEVLKLVPNELREASYALGVPTWRTIVKIVLPTAAAGLATGITLAIARVIGETAPLLITLGITNATQNNPFSDQRMATLPVYAFYQLTQPGFPPKDGIDRAWTAALVLIIIVMALNFVARLISRFFAPKTGR